MVIKVRFELFNLIQGVELRRFPAPISTGASWILEPPQRLKPYASAVCECWGPDTGYEVTLAYEPDQFRLLKVTCRPTGTDLNATSYASEGYEVTLGPGGGHPNYILGLNYRRE